ncbi:MAG TPA: glucose-6-phosphate isomerase, partial [Spirochaetales bacterium]|nr:glucose-6-phosphate isomerase [Spirochaetales bacterium]
MSAYRRLDECQSFSELIAGSPEPAARAEAFRAAFDGDRVRSRELPAGGGLSWNWAAMDVLDRELPLLAKLAAEQECVAKYRELASGAVMNTGEKRMVLHHLARGVVAGRPVHGGKDLRDFYEGERARLSDFAARVRSGALKGATGKKFATVVQIGIGGSDLGPRALHIALSAWAKAAGRLALEARFVSNVDPDDANSVLDGLDLESTLFVLVSKSGTTQETLANESLAKAKLEKAGLPPSKHLVAVTSETSPLARNPGYLESFYIDDFIGGRY